MVSMLKLLAFHRSIIYYLSPTKYGARLFHLSPFLRVTVPLHDTFGGYTSASIQISNSHLRWFCLLFLMDMPITGLRLRWFSFRGQVFPSFTEHLPTWQPLLSHSFPFSKSLCLLAPFQCLYFNDYN